MVATFDTIFRNASIIDGDGRPAVTGDVAVDGPRIVEVGSVDATATNEVDCTGLTLTPGFIDVHTHDDWAVFQQPDMGFKTLQGVTSVVVGNCGTSAVAPASKWRSIDEYFSAIGDAPCSTNVATFIGHGSLRTAVMGDDQARHPTRNEMRDMADHVERAMSEGSLGLSTGLVYHPGRHSQPDEIVALATIVARFGGMYASHMRDEGTGLLESITETIEVGERTGVRVQVSHLKAYGSANWGCTVQAVEMIRNAQARGVRVMVDQYPYTRGSTLLQQILSGGGFSGAQTPYGALRGEQATVSDSPGHPEWIGRTIAEIAGDMGVTHVRAAELICDATANGCFVVTDTMSEEDVLHVMGQDFTMIGSDGIPSGGRPHPRLFHTFPRVLGHYSRDLGHLPLEEAVRRMTSLPCDHFGFAGRGRIRVGNFADITLFDATRIVDTGTYIDPSTVPSGVVGTWVNGVRTTVDGAITGARPGVGLRHHANQPPAQ